jgi:hypothetical protein
MYKAQLKGVNAAGSSRNLGNGHFLFDALIINE